MWIADEWYNSKHHWPRLCAVGLQTSSFNFEASPAATVDCRRVVITLCTTGRNGRLILEDWMITKAFLPWFSFSVPTGLGGFLPINLSFFFSPKWPCLFLTSPLRWLTRNDLTRDSLTCNSLTSVAAQPMMVWPAIAWPPMAQASMAPTHDGSPPIARPPTARPYCK